MFKKVRFYKDLIIEVLETLCAICQYLENDNIKNHKVLGLTFKPHFFKLKEFSNVLREEGKRC